MKFLSIFSKKILKLQEVENLGFGLKILKSSAKTFKAKHIRLAQAKSILLLLISFSK